MKISALIVLAMLFAGNAKAEVVINDEINGENISSAFGARARDSRGVISRIIPQTSLIVSSYTGSGASSFSARSGLGAGVTVDLGRDDLVFEPGILYRQMGSKATSDIGNGEFMANYISLPFAGKYYFDGQKDNSAFVKFGLMPSFLLSTESTSKTPLVSFNGPELNSFDLDFIIGLGGKLQMNNSTAILLGIDYLRGISNAVPNSGAALYNQAFIFTAGVGFDSN